MKKIGTIASILFIPIASNAQSIVQVIGDQELTRALAGILVMYLIGVFILIVIRSMQEQRLKTKLIEKGVSEKVIEQFLQPANKDPKNHSIKVFLVLTALGLGLTIITFTMPLGIHSIAIMAFCIAAAYLSFYFFIKQSEKK